MVIEQLGKPLKFADRYSDMVKIEEKQWLSLIYSCSIILYIYSPHFSKTIHFSRLIYLKYYTIMAGEPEPQTHWRREPV